MLLTASVHGFVQGVNFRASVKKRAGELGLKGYVENLKDGSVEVVTQGPEEALNNMLKYLNKGPILAQVSSVDYYFSDKNDNFITFEVKRASSFLEDQTRAYLGFTKNILKYVTRR